MKKPTIELVNDYGRAMYNEGRDKRDPLAGCIEHDELRTRLETLERDAARHQFMRCRLTVADVLCERLRDDHSEYNGKVDSAIDTLIDAAMAEGGE